MPIPTYDEPETVKCWYCGKIYNTRDARKPPECRPCTKALREGREERKARRIFAPPPLGSRRR